MEESAKGIMEWTPELIAQCLAQWSPPAGVAELRWNGKQWVTK